MEANCNGVLSSASAMAPENGLEKVPLDDDGGDPSNRPLSSSASSSSCTSSTASLSGQPSKSGKSADNQQANNSNDKAPAFTRKFDVFVQYLASKGVFIIDCKSLLDGRSCSVQREYEDFRGLHDLLETLSRRVTITPPLPPFCPLSELLDADEAPTEQQAHLFYFGGEALKTLEEYKIVPSQAAAFAYYLDAVLRHPLLGSIAQVEEFLAHARFSRPEIDTAHFSHRRSLFNSSSGSKTQTSSSNSILSYVSSKFGRSGNGANSNGVNGASSSSSGVSPTASSSISDAANGTGGEESFYECCRAHTALAEEKLSAVKGSLEVVLASTTKLANVISHLSTCVLATLVINAPDQSAKSSSASTSTTTTFYRTFVSSLEKYRAHLEVEAPMTEETLLSALRYLLAYNASFRSMLARRQELALAYETANRNFQRQMDSGSGGGIGGGSSASKKNYERAAAEKRHAEADFEKFNESGREEVERYQAQRARLLATAIGRYVEGRLVMAKHTAAMLKGCIASLKAIE